MQRVKIVWTRPAADDLREIKRFIARDAPLTAIAYVRKLKKSVERLRFFPQLGATVPEIDKSDIREILYGSYRIIYRESANLVEILAVYHAARLLDDDSINVG